MLKENREVTLEAVGVPLEVLTYHGGPVQVVLPIGQDGDNDLQQRCTEKERQAFYFRGLRERLF